MAKRTETQLVVTAKDLGSKTLKDLAKAFGELRKQQRETNTVADRTKVKQAEIQATLAGLNKVLNDLTGRQAKVELFRKWGENAAASKAKIAGLEKELLDLDAATSAADRKSEAYLKTKKRLTTALSEESRYLVKAESNYAAASAQVEKLGLNSAEAEGRLNSLVAVTKRAATEAEGALSQLPRQQRLYREEMEKTASAQKEQLALLQKQKDARRLALEQARALRVAQEAGGNVGGFKGFSQNATAIQRNLALGTQQTRQREADVAATKRQIELEKNYQGWLSKRSGVLGQVTSAIRSNMAAQDRANKATRDGVSLQRTALSLNQRIRGQLLSLASAYIGVFGAISIGQRALDVTNKRFTLNARLLVANADNQKAAADDFAFLRQEADRLGFSLTELGGAYSKMAIAGKSAGLTTNQVREIFSNFSEVSRVNGLGVEETERVFKALEQILSKGKVQAEELRGQLGDVLPGAYSAFARSLGKTGEELDDLLKKGQVSSGALVKFSRTYAQMVEGQLSASTKTFRAEVGRLNTAFDDILQSISEDSLAPAIADLSRELRIFLKSGEAKEFAGQLGTAIKGVAYVLLQVAKNMSYVITLTKLWLLSFSVQKLSALGVGLLGVAARVADVGGKFLIAARHVGVFNAAVGLLAATPWGRILGVVGVALAALIPLLGRAGNAQEEMARKFVAAEEAITKYGESISDAEQKTYALEDAVLSAEDARKREDAALARYNKNKTEANKLAAEAATKARKEADANAELRQELARVAAEKRAAAQEAAKQHLDSERRLLEEALSRQKVAQQALAQAASTLAAVRASAIDPNNPNALLPGAVASQDYKKRKKEADAVQAELRAQTKNVEDLTKAYVDLNAPAVREPDPSGLNNSSGDDAKAARDKSADEAKRLAEETADAIRDIYRSGLEQQTEDEATALAAKRQLINDDYNQRVKDLDAIIGQNKTAGQDGAVSALTASRVELEKQRTVALDLLDAEYKRVGQLRDLETRERSLTVLANEREAKLAEIERQRIAFRITDEAAAIKSYAVELDYQKKIQDAVLQLRTFILAGKEDGSLKLFTPEELQDIIDRITGIGEAASAGIDPVKTKVNELREEIANGLTDSVSTLAKGFAGWIQGANSFSDALKGAWNTFRTFIADFLVRIGEAILQQTILNALIQATENSSGGFGKALFSAASMMLGSKHTGGIIGTEAKTRSLNPAIFAAAQRYHTGGVVGLGPDEVPIVAKRGEEMLTENDPRHRANGGMSGAKINIINAIDSASVVTQGNSSPAGTRSILNVVRANKAAFRAALA